ncbi:MAG TPA: GNAT family N-acetyltransferase [candidate division Zixibacteria bacterium]|nr:GNAT family N-acetyltransferase [candidate division Zixibacteria bacterium]
MNGGESESPFEREAEAVDYPVDYPLDYIEAAKEWRQRVKNKWGEKEASHLHFEDGFTIVAVEGETIAGYISCFWQMLPEPLGKTQEAFIDIIEVDDNCRRRGVGSRLVKIASERTSAEGIYQIRAWSSADKIEAIPFWQSLGFGLAPATVAHGEDEIRGFYALKVLAQEKE